MDWFVKWRDEMRVWGKKYLTEDDPGISEDDVTDLENTRYIVWCVEEEIEDV